MSNRKRIAMGLLAGAMLVLVKMIGPDRELVAYWFTKGSAGEVASYVVLAAATIALSACAGLFSTDTDPIKFLIFCASAPALFSTVISERRVPEPVRVEEMETGQGAPGKAASWSFFGAAYAQDPDSNVVCREPGFFQDFAKSTKDYLTGSINSEDSYIVVVQSTKDLQTARQTAERIGRVHPEWNPQVGCRRPDNEFFPVTIGNRTNQLQAAELSGKFSETGLLSDEPYLSSYPFRESIYSPTGIQTEGPPLTP